MQNWTYSNSSEHVNHSYIVTLADLGFYSTYQAAVNLNQTDDSFDVDARISKYHFKFTLDMGFILDDHPAITVRPQPWWPIDLTNGTDGKLFIVPREISFCEPMPPGNQTSVTLTPWKNIYYDPSLSVLFAPVSNTPAATSNNKGWIAAAVVVPIVAVLIVGAILLVVYVPAVRVFFRPFSKHRAPMNQMEHAALNHNNGEWKPAEKPTFDDSS